MMQFGGVGTPKPRLFGRVLAIVAAVFAVLILIGGAGSYLYWQSLKSTPQYSLALLVDAAGD
jgi:hypothetical protein